MFHFTTRPALVSLGSALLSPSSSRNPAAGHSSCNSNPLFSRRSIPMSTEGTARQRKLLLALDFDHTIVDDNTDIAVTKLAPGGNIPPEIKALWSKNGWTKFMAEIFRYLHQHKASPEQMLQVMTELQFSPGMVELLSGVDRDKTETIIISDSNSVFIETILRHHKMQHLVNKVFTNPAEFNDKGQLEISMYHVQDTCSLSTVNLCKGQVLESYIAERASQNVDFTHVAYIGDGQNDFCPSLRLRESDFVFPRHGYSLVKYIEKMKEKGLHIKANVHFWNSGLEILDVLHQNIPYLRNEL